MNKNRKVLVKMIYAALIAALYSVITIFTIPISYGPLQFRAAEAFNILPLFFPESIIGLTIGCFISNLFSSGNVLLDCTLGTTGTLLSALSCYFIGKCIKNEHIKVILGIIPTIIINAIIVPFTFLAMTELKELYFTELLFVGLGQLGVMVILGIPLYYSLKKIIKRNIYLN